MLTEGNYYSSKEHKNTGSQTGTESNVIVVKTYQGIRNAISTFVREGRDEGILKISEYDGDVPTIVESVCAEIARDTSIGAYAVESMTQTCTKTATFYQVIVKIEYRHTQEQIRGIVYLNNVSAVQTALAGALLGHKDYLVISIASETINEQYIKDFVIGYYRSEPKSLIVLPSVTTAVYERGDNPRLLEIQIMYPYTAEQEDAMKNALAAKTAKLLANAKSSSEAYSAMKACSVLAASASFSRAYGSPTAYGTVMDGIGNSEGYAMAFKLFCASLGVKCTVVEGTLEGLTHFWNIIEVDDFFYHVDPSACDFSGMGAGFLKDDLHMRDAMYAWDALKYEQCSGTLTYKDIV